MSRFPHGQNKVGDGKCVVNRRSKGLDEVSDCNAPKTSNACDWAINHERFSGTLFKAHDQGITQWSGFDVGAGISTQV